MSGLRHVVLLQIDPEAGPDRPGAIAEVLRTLPDAIPEIRSYVVGTDAGLAEGNSALAIVADFDSVADYEVYRDHPAHQAAIADHILPYVTGRSALQHEV